MQGIHEEAPAEEYVLIPQFVHQVTLVTPVVKVKVPAAQFIQPNPSPIPTYPTGH